MGRGRILKVGEPLQIMRELNGKLWTQEVKREEVAEMRPARVSHVLTEIWCKRYEVGIAKIIRPSAADRKRPFRRS